MNKVRDPATRERLDALEEDCRMALDGSWNRSNEGFEAMIESIREIKKTLLGKRETAAILAGLRILQKEDVWRHGSLDWYAFNAFMDDIRTNGWTLDSLTTEEIDTLCDKINTKGAVK